MELHLLSRILIIFLRNLTWQNQQTDFFFKRTLQRERFLSTRVHWKLDFFARLIFWKLLLNGFLSTSPLLKAQNMKHLTAIAESYSRIASTYGINFNEDKIRFCSLALPGERVQFGWAPWGPLLRFWEGIRWFLEASAVADPCSTRPWHYHSNTMRVL